MAPNALRWFLPLLMALGVVCLAGCGDDAGASSGPWGGEPQSDAGEASTPDGQPDTKLDGQPDTVSENSAEGSIPQESGADAEFDSEPVDTPTCDAATPAGDYCGGNKVLGGDLNALYTCNGAGPAKLKEVCPSGCQTATSGSDHCKPPAAPTCTSTAKNGDYCGGDKIVDGDPNTLYTCAGPGPAKLKEACAEGCVIAPPGYDDSCGSTKATCTATAKTGDYCGGDKVDNADPKTLYVCNGPGTAKIKQACADGCVVAPAGSDDYCKVDAPDCPHMALLKWGLAPDASDHLRCAGVTASMISQTIGNAPASAGTHLQDGTIAGQPYCAATDLSVSSMSDAQVYDLVDRLASQGFAPFFRKPGYDGWPSSGARHVHTIYAGVKMKSSLQAQVKDWLVGLNGLASHTAYTFFKPTQVQKNLVSSLFNAHN